MKIRFRISTDTEKTEFIISINCSNNELQGLGGDLNGMDIDNRQKVTQDFIKAVNIMSGKEDFVYVSWYMETKDKD